MNIFCNCKIKHTAVFEYCHHISSAVLPSSHQDARCLCVSCSVNMRVYNATGAMHEKYDVTTPAGKIGGGGEYAPQVGFGWSNGVALDFLANYC